jgi:molybdate transport system ATP-binding protein
MTTPWIQLEDVDVALEGRRILHGLRWTLRPGENWVVLGRNGSGKSTFLKLVRGEIWPAPGGTGWRRYAFDGDEQTTAVGVKEKIAMVSPESQARYLQQEWSLTAAQVIHSGFHGGDYAYQSLTVAQQERTIGLVTRFGIGPLLPRDVQTLSTGELRKVLIARALAGFPRVLICDEICDGLDAPSRHGLLRMLDRLARDGVAVLYTTHREDELFPALTHRARLQDGRIVESGPIAARRVPAAAPPGTTRTPSQRFSASPAQSARGRPGRTLLRIAGADVYLGAAPALAKIDLEIRAGEHWAILGPNGSGKSTLLKLMHGDLHPARGGRVQRFGFTLRHTIWELKRRIGFISPELQAAYRESISGRAAVASGFFASFGVHRRVSARQLARADRTLAALGLVRLGAQNILRMSYGEARKILIARALVHEPALLLCDEPFDGLDAPSRAEVASLLEAAARGGASLVMVTHHLGDLPRCITHVAELESGRIVRQGPLEARGTP